MFPPACSRLLTNSQPRQITEGQFSDKWYSFSFLFFLLSVAVYCQISYSCRLVKLHFRYNGPVFRRAGVTRVSYHHMANRLINHIISGKKKIHSLSKTLLCVYIQEKVLQSSFPKGN